MQKFKHAKKANLQYFALFLSYFNIKTVKFLSVAASPIEAAPQTFKKNAIFLTKVT